MGMEASEKDLTQALDRVRATTAELEVLRVRENEISTARTDDIVLLRSSGVTREAIADAAGLTPARVTQILARVGGVTVPKAPKVYVSVPGAAKKGSKRAKAVAPEPHRHHFESVAWNHARGNFLVRQKCACGDVRVITTATVPRELTNRYADTTVVA